MLLELSRRRRCLRFLPSGARVPGRYDDWLRRTVGLSNGRAMLPMGGAQRLLVVLCIGPVRGRRTLQARCGLHKWVVYRADLPRACFRILRCARPALSLTTWSELT